MAMSVPWYASYAFPQGQGGYWGPVPVTTTSTGWTWDVEFSPVSGSLYARASISNLFGLEGDFWAAGGIVQYRTKDASGKVTTHNFDQPYTDGLTPIVWANNVESVTFGWSIYGGNFCAATINMEIWI
jgi:hypothetical protein